MITKSYTLVRVTVERGKVKHSEDLSTYTGEYNPTNFLDDVRSDSEINAIPRVMCSLDAMYGTMEKSGTFAIARQHKFTAPKSYVAYYIRVDNSSL